MTNMCAALATTGGQHREGRSNMPDHNNYEIGDGGGGVSNGQPAPKPLRWLLGVKLAGGTLVEYRERCEFRKEFVRAPVTANARMEPGSYQNAWRTHDFFTIQTSKFKYGLNLGLIREPTLYQVGDVYLWQNPGYPTADICYAAAPWGVTIPGPEWVQPAWQELHRRLAQDRRSTMHLRRWPGGGELS